MKKNKVDLQKFSKEKLQEIVSQCLDKADLAKKLGFNFTNGKVYKKIVQLVAEHNISIDHFDASKKVKLKRKYPIIKKICPVCAEEFETQQGHPKEKETCSCKCANTFFSDQKHGPEQRLKVSHALIEFYDSPSLTELVNGEILFKKNCQKCGKPFHSAKANTMCCSVSCAAQLRSENPETRKKLSVAIQQRIANGLHKGWMSRHKLEPSYAEKYVISLLNELGFQYERELKVGKWFVDFSMPEQKLALEIDGKQHERKERKLSDEQKDKYLIDNGWQVCRIKWKKITKEFREEMIKIISEFFNQSIVQPGRSIDLDSIDGCVQIALL